MNEEDMLFFCSLTPEMATRLDSVLQRVLASEAAFPRSQARHAWECRLDLLDSLPEFLVANPMRQQWMATYRSIEHGGAGLKHLRNSLGWKRRLEALSQGAQWLDLECDEGHLKEKIDTARGKGAKTVLSGHYFEDPPDWDHVLSQYEEGQPDVIKIICMGHSFADFKTQRRLYAQSKLPLVHFFMGGEFQSTRLLSMIYGAPFTFVASSSGSAVAPGQLTDQACACLLPDAVNEPLHLYAIAGYPVSHSRSPAFHQPLLRQVHPNVFYLKFPIQNQQELAEAWRLFPELMGMSVTKPVKEAAAALSSGHQLQACNTLVRQNRGLTGMNTDAEALKAILLAEKDTIQREKPVLRILGYGGVGKTAETLAHHLGFRVQLFNRTQKHLTGCHPDSEIGIWQQRQTTGCDVLLQATSVGMGNNTQTPMESLPEGVQSVIETIYHPRETALLKMARTKGIRHYDGVSFFQAQAECQSRIFLKAQRRRTFPVKPTGFPSET
ncbi:MAG: hypothetical protein CSA81_12790 [Acidobacteria bacterium]|nr:MAG: hypothetical protein CSA81_12790 [Acidobacteriota bacterium]